MLELLPAPSTAEARSRFAQQTARYLTGLTTHCAPRAVVRSVPIDENALLGARRERKAWATRFTGRHLPRGAPTSAALANLCAYRFDLRLAGAAEASLATYTRYVNDLLFSSETLSAQPPHRPAGMVPDLLRLNDPDFRIALTRSLNTHSTMRRGMINAFPTTATKRNAVQRMEVWR